MKKSLKIFTAILLFLLILAGCKKTKLIPEIVLGKTTIELVEGNQEKIAVEIKNFTDEVTFTSQNTKVATVDKTGVVTAVGSGETYIEIAAGSAKAQVKIIVKKLAKAINLELTEIKLLVDETYTIKYTLTNLEGNVVFSSLNNDIISVNETGVVTALSKGEGKVKLSLQGVEVTFTVNVVEGVNYQVVHILKAGAQEEEYEVKSFSGKEGTEVTAQSIAIEGFTQDTAQNEFLKKTLVSGEENKLKVYYKRLELLGYTLITDGGCISYKTRMEMSNDFINDYNAKFSKNYTPESFGNLGPWSEPNNVAKLLYDETYRTKWLWLAKLLGSIGSTSNKKACGSLATIGTYDEFMKKTNYNYATSYEFRGFIAGIHYTKNGYWKASDYTKPELANAYCEAVDKDRGHLKKEGINKVYTELPECYKEGFKFLGWFDGDTKVLKLYLTKDLLAKYEPINPLEEITITLTKTEYSIDEKGTLSYKLNPEETFYKKVVFESTDHRVIKIDKDSGEFTCENPGTCELIVKSLIYNKEARIQITVNEASELNIVFTDTYDKGYLEVGEKTNLVVTKYGVLKDRTVTFTSSNEDALSVTPDGEVLAKQEGLYEVAVKCDDLIYTVYLSVSKIAGGTAAEKLLKEITKIHNQNISFYTVSLLHDKNYYLDTQNGFVNDYLFEKLVIDESYTIPESDALNHSSGVKPSIEFVCVHDTANINGGAKNHGNFFKNTTSVSINYIVGDQKVYRSLPEKYIAWHAGDGVGTPFSWDNTGVKYKPNTVPKISINSDGKYTIYGETSLITAPKDKSGNILDETYFTYLGPAWKVDPITNNVLLGTTYFQDRQTTRGVIASHGGNNNSVGIEMCVNTNGDIRDTWRRTAKLVADILFRNNLDLTRVCQHNTFDGKTCPQSMLVKGLDIWNEFMKLVEFELKLLKEYSDYEITMTLKKPELSEMVSSIGKISNDAFKTFSIPVEITVKKGSEVASIVLTSLAEGRAVTKTRYKGFYNSYS